MKHANPSGNNGTIVYWETSSEDSEDESSASLNVNRQFVIDTQTGLLFCQLSLNQLIAH